jgi:hypothetical protein
MRRARWRVFCRVKCRFLDGQHYQSGFQLSVSLHVTFFVTDIQLRWMLAWGKPTMRAFAAARGRSHWGAVVLAEALSSLLALSSGVCYPTSDLQNVHPPIPPVARRSLAKAASTPSACSIFGYFLLWINVGS